MSELIKKEEINICPSFSKSEIEIVNNSNTIRILNLTEEEIIINLSESIGNAILVVGNKSLEVTDVSIIIQQISSYLKENNQYDKIGEIKQAIKLGSFGRFKKEKDQREEGNKPRSGLKLWKQESLEMLILTKSPESIKLLVLISQLTTRNQHPEEPIYTFLLQARKIGKNYHFPSLKN